MPRQSRNAPLPAGMEIPLVCPARVKNTKQYDCSRSPTAGAATKMLTDLPFGWYGFGISRGFNVEFTMAGAPAFRKAPPQLWGGSAQGEMETEHGAS